MNNLKLVLTTSVFFIFLNGYCSAKDNYSLEWRMENPFKFFTEKDIYWEMKKLYDEGNSSLYEDNKGLMLERLLQDESTLGRRYRKLGWATYFRNTAYKNTCWDMNKMLYRNDGKCQNYIDPKEHRIEVKLNNVSDKFQCEWSVKGKESIQSSCHKFTTITVPYDVNKSDTQIDVTVLDTNITNSFKVEIKDLLIVGLGDSYGSGEGNPDQPTTFMQKDDNFDRFLSPNFYTPRKDYIDKNKKSLGHKPANWLDRRCHRSLYSYQFKTALQLSLENPQQSITFVSFACTGAETQHLIDTPKKAAEHIKVIQPRIFDKQSPLSILNGEKDNSVRRKTQVYPQIKLLDKTLGESKRKIDFLLLSIGGNDIEFSKYIMNLVLEPKLLRTIVKKPKEDVDFTIIEKNYIKLNKKLKPYLKDQNVSRIILTAYPPILKDENSTLCKGDREIFDITFGKTNDREDRIKKTHDLLAKPFFEVQKSMAEKLEWSLAKTHRDKYINHGFCAQKTDLNVINENLIIPYKVRKKDKWKPFSPDKYQPYGTTQRWFIIPVDSTLMINLTKGGFDIGFLDESSGIMHPNAEGLSVTADANVKLITDISKKIK